jgi:hypothetical protein
MVALASEPQEDTRKHGFRMISGMIQRFFRFLGPVQYYADLCRYRYTGLAISSPEGPRRPGPGFSTESLLAAGALVTMKHDNNTQ